MMCSLSASPEPRPSQCRPGYIAASVADAWATIAGCIRNEGHVTPGPTSPFVRSPMRRQHVPDERRLALLRDPRLEVVGGHDAAEPVLLGERGVVDDLLRPELLEHRRIADLALAIRSVLQVLVDARSGGRGSSPGAAARSGRGSSPRRFRRVVGVVAAGHRGDVRLGGRLVVDDRDRAGRARSSCSRRPGRPPSARSADRGGGCAGQRRPSGLLITRSRRRRADTRRRPGAGRRRDRSSRPRRSVGRRERHERGGRAGRSGGASMRPMVTRRCERDGAVQDARPSMMPLGARRCALGAYGMRVLRRIPRRPVPSLRRCRAADAATGRSADRRRGREDDPVSPGGRRGVRRPLACRDGRGAPRRDRGGRRIRRGPGCDGFARRAAEQVALAQLDAELPERREVRAASRSPRRAAARRCAGRTRRTPRRAPAWRRRGRCRSRSRGRS